MPSVPIYIRQEDWETWKSIGKKAEFIHNALQQADAYKSMSNEERKAVKEHINKLPEAVEMQKSPEQIKEELYPNIIKKPEDIPKVVKGYAPISKGFSSRKKGSKERHVEL